MRINVFFISIFVVLSAIFILFKPLNLKNIKSENMPLLTLSTFTMYELSNKGLTTLMSGTDGEKFKDKYVVKDIDYTDNSKDFIANIKSNTGTYKNDIVILRGDVVYSREDGLTFETQSSTYDKKTGIAKSDGQYILYKGPNKATGTKLRYNNVENTVNSKNVTVKYKYEER